MPFLIIASQLLLVLGIFLVAYLAGKALVKNLAGMSPLEEVAVLTPVGLAMFVLCLFFLGLAGLLRPLPVVVIAVVFISLGIWRGRGTFPGSAWISTWQRMTPWHWLLVVVSFVLFLPLLMAPVAPPYQSDEIRYHLPYALDFLEQGALVPNLFLRYPFNALNINLLYVLTLMAGNDVSPHFMHFGLGCLAALMLFVLARRLTNTVIAYLSVWLFFLTPAVTQLLSNAYIDLGLTCFAFTALACLAFQDGQRQPALVLCAALLFGAALGSKYLALAYFLPMIAWAFFYSRDAGMTFRFTMLSLVFGLPWYAWNLAYAGNPISPFAGDWFGYYPWSAADMVAQQEEMASHGTDTSLLSLLKLPWDLAMNSWRFQNPRTPYLLLVLFPGLLLLPWWPQRLRPFGVLVLLAIIGWFMGTQVFRYLTTFLPLWCLLSVWLVYRGSALVTARFLPAEFNVGGFSLTPMSWLPVILVTVLLVQDYALNSELVYPSRAAYLVRERDSFLRNNLVGYGMARYLEDNGYRGETVYQVRTEALPGYVRSSRVIGDVFGPLGYVYLLTNYARNQDGMIEDMAAHGVTLLAVRKNYLKNQPQFGRYFRQNLAVEYEDDEAVLFRVAAR